MSEHIQQAPDAHAAAAQAHERTPGVSRESEWFNFWLICKVGVGLAAVIAAILAIDWWLLHGLEKANTLPAGSVSTLALDDARRPLGQRLLDVPPPLLDGIRIEPRGVEAARQRAEARMNRYGWTDRQQDVAHIPVAAAMEEVLKSKAFRPSAQKKSDGRLAPPARSNSGRGREGDKP